MSCRRASLTSGVEEKDGRLGALRVGIASLLVVCVFAAAVVVANEPWEEELSGSVVGPAAALQPVASPGSTAPVAAGPKGSDAAKFALEPRPASLPVQVEFDKPPAAGVMFDVDSGKILWQKAPYRELPIASLTKMMTALLIVERHRPGEHGDDHRRGARLRGLGGRGAAGRQEGPPRADAQRAAAGVGKRRRDRARPARRGKRRGLRQADEHAGACGSGSRARTSRARTGSRTRATTRARSTWRQLARADLAKPRIREIVGVGHARLPFPIKGGFLDLYNNNPFIQNGTPGITGLKTGYTDAAGRCYVMTRKVGGRHLGVVLLDSPHPAPPDQRADGRRRRTAECPAAGPRSYICAAPEDHRRWGRRGRRGP